MRDEIRSDTRKQMKAGESGKSGPGRAGAPCDVITPWAGNCFSQPISLPMTTARLIKINRVKYYPVCLDEINNFTEQSNILVSRIRTIGLERLRRITWTSKSPIWKKNAAESYSSQIICIIIRIYKGFIAIHLLC